MNTVRFFLSNRLVLARAAREKGFEVHVAAPESGDASQIVAEGFDFHPLPVSRSGVRPWEEARSVWAFYKLLRRLRPDLLHLWTIKFVTYGGLAARMAHTPALIATIPGLGYIFRATGTKAASVRMLVRRLYKIGLKHPNSRVVFLNHDDLNEFLQMGLVAAESAVVIKGSGVNTDRFIPVPEPDGVPVVLLACRMLADKGVSEYVEAAGLIRDAGITARFLLVGEPDTGNPSSISRDRLESWNQSGVVEYQGWQSDMPSLLRKSHIVCLPSYYREGIPRILIEAAACGRPIITTDEPGCREVVRHNENGILIPARSSSALAAAIRTLLEDQELRRRLGQRGREIAVEEFSEQRVIADTLALYDEICQPPAAL